MKFCNYNGIQLRSVETLILNFNRFVDKWKWLDRFTISSHFNLFI